MLVKLINSVTKTLLDRCLPTPVFSQLLAQQKIYDILDPLTDGLLLATPKRRTTLREKWRKRYGNDNFTNSTTLWKPKNNIVTCTECGNFHEFHTICRACYKKVEDESKKIIEGIRNMWGKEVIDKEVQVLYKGESTTPTSKRIVEIDRPRPLWFATNLSHKAAKLTKSDHDSLAESENRTVRLKVNGDKEI